MYEYEDSFDCEIELEKNRIFRQCLVNINEGKHLGYAHYMMATNYRFGWGTDINYELAFVHYDLAVKYGSSRAARELCIIYLCKGGSPIPGIYPNYLKALEYIRLGASFPITEDNKESDIHLCASMIKMTENCIKHEKKICG